MKYFETQIHGLQWMLFMLANSLAVPIAIAQFIGLNHAETVSIVQHVLLISGLFSILQAWIGHRLTINEGAGSMWFGYFIIMGTMAPALGLSKEELLSGLALAVISGGAVTLLLGLTGAVGWLKKLFTPAITGTFSILLALQLGNSYTKGILGISSEQTEVQLPSLMIGLVVIIVIIGITIYGKGIFRTIGLLIGIIVGWILFAVFGLLDPVSANSAGLFPDLIPTPMVWDLGFAVTGAITGILVLSNSITGITVMSGLHGKEADHRSINRGSIVTGIADMAGGAIGTPGYAPFMSASGLVAVTKVTSRLPFIIGAGLMFAISLINPIANWIATLPAPVACAALLGTLSQMFAIGIQDFKKLPMENRDIFVIGLSIICGVAIFTFPTSFFASLPSLLQLVLSNGMMVGLLLAIVLEHILLRRQQKNMR